MRIVK